MSAGRRLRVHRGSSSLDLLVRRSESRRGWGEPLKSRTCPAVVCSACTVRTRDPYGAARGFAVVADRANTICVCRLTFALCPCLSKHVAPRIRWGGSIQGVTVWLYNAVGGTCFAQCPYN